MIAVSPFLAEISALLDEIEAGLIEQSPDTLMPMCQRLQLAFQNQARISPKHEWSSSEDQLALRSIDQRLAMLKKTMLQQGAATERALATLLPNRSVASYGSKSGFATPTRSTHLKSYQA